ncbi:hypothetical protein [Hansschlegelia sp. KR7-227]|jgi:hypothetical protein|uniref:hypothetical protein n=1 Tax=Hansschlegelia sp. KR7-227 TaxID=3400914 RepID=UPI003BFAE5F3
MKRLLWALGAVCLFAAPAAAQTKEQRYQGTFFVTAASDDCATDRTASVGDNGVFTFRTETQKQAFSIFEPRSGGSVVPSTNKRFGKSGNYRMTWIGGGAIAKESTGAYSAFATKPAAFAPGTETVVVNGRLTNYQGTAGCTISFEASGLRRPGY